jgi:hypothetical protein
LVPFCCCGFLDKKHYKIQSIHHKIKEKSHLTTHSGVFSAKECDEKRRFGMGKRFCTACGFAHGGFTIYYNKE